MNIFLMSWAFILLIALWDAVWKGIALWRAGRSNQLAWFIALFILNTAGILPIIYLAFFQRSAAEKAKRAKKKK